ncbi:MAG: bifunctional (p)ppGpp synthetase/guanosine-3',5'-bis(diphosphate) 3'-pyrophosphohydrolase, partial [Proteobacteria bacterium]|nr:bifunctional (p)ppGpp synthetase/guanosine-3',5'-bis(diphosphate) 3'-pyrophosphohydrolase [Pseudomonadota bacterium]
QSAFKTLKEKTNSYLDQDDKRLVHKAVHFGAHAHEKQIRKSGDPYITHPIIVATILAEMRVDVDTLIAGILHDTIEDTDTNFDQLTREFGKQVALLVEGVTKLDKLKYRNLKEAQAETFVKMLFAMADDIRVIVIKLSDRLHNMRTIEFMSPSGQRRIARETIDIYAPIAERIGLKSVQSEMEAHAFKALQPAQFEHLTEKIKLVSGNRKKAVEKIRKNIEKSLLVSGLVATVQGRQKSIYSLYKKIKHKDSSFDQITDLFGVRIIVKELNQCYVALGVIHNLYPPIEHGFKDYIAVPKQNGYQSLHSVVKGPYGLTLEVQIRTDEMDDMCSAGIAAHWMYKRKKSQSNQSLMKARNWVNSLLKLQKDSGSSLEFYENLKNDMGTGEIYVFTPKGEVVQLPKNSTILDCAVAIHTWVGSHAKGATVNGEMARLGYVLKTGETVKIETANKLTVNTEWLGHVFTSRARTAIRKELKQIKDEDALILGHRMLDRALDTFGYSFERLDSRSIKRVLKTYQLKSMDELLKSFAYGELLPSIAARKLMPLLKQRRLDKQYKPKEAFTIDGSEGSIVHYPNCCQPVPGDNIVGYLSPAKGVVVHRDDCSNLVEIKKATPERMLESRWNVVTNGTFKTTIELDVINKTGVLAKLAAIIADQNVNIENISQTDKDGGYTKLTFVVDVVDKNQFAALVSKLLSYPEVLNAKRKTS